MKRIKEIIDFIKEKLSNKRTRAITILSLYFIFFAFLILLINIGSSTTTTESEKIINNKYINLNKDYEYKYNVEIQTSKEVNKYLITGNYINNEKSETIKKQINQEYQNIDNYDLVNEEGIYIENILRYIENKDYEFQTIYKDGRTLENYKISLNEINNKFEKDKYIEFNIESLNNFITKITFNYTDIDSQINNDIILSKYTLEYKAK